MLLLRIDFNQTFKVIQIYAPTTASDDDEGEEFYSELESTLIIKSTYTVMMGDSSAKFRRGRKTKKSYISSYSIGKRNDRAVRTAATVEANRLFVGNIWFWKKVGLRWIYCSKCKK